jgi:hypothetical protein
MEQPTIITEENGVLTIKTPTDVTLTFEGNSEVKLNELVSNGKLNIVAMEDTDAELKKIEKKNRKSNP